jgi:LysM repeat protein
MRLILLLGSAFCLWAAATGVAQESAPSTETSLESEIKEIRQLIEQQNRQLEALSRQFSAMKDYVTSGGGVQPAGKPVTPPAAAPAARTPTPGATPPPSAPAVAATPANTAPDAEGAPAGATPGKHTVAKGETLTSIAKRYNIPLADLEKANPIQNDRMLQIGQTLTIPSPNASAPAAAPSSPKSPEPQTQKKENP